MTNTLAHQLDALSAWRRTLERRVRGIARLPGRTRAARRVATAAALDALNRKLAADKLVLAFVAEFSRGKSELINAIFFADTGRRVLPATPGRTTMCPVELQYHAGQPAELALLPIDTRLDGPVAGRAARAARGLAAPRAWTPRNPDGLAEALNQVTRTRRVSTDDGRARSASGTTSHPRTTRRGWPTARSRCRPGAMR